MYHDTSVIYLVCYLPVKKTSKFNHRNEISELLFLLDAINQECTGNKTFAKPTKYHEPITIYIHI